MMKVLIEIPDHLYAQIKCYSNIYAGLIDKAIRKGIVLPSAEAFCEGMKEIVDNNDPEVGHAYADEYMMAFLSSIGYEKGVAVFNDMERWYA